jgi:hypothetical protein
MEKVKAGIKSPNKQEQEKDERKRSRKNLKKLKKTEISSFEKVSDD